jgi:hypothetical protein
MRWENLKLMATKATQVVASSSTIMPIKRKLMPVLFNITPPSCIIRPRKVRYFMLYQHPALLAMGAPYRQQEPIVI